MGLVIGSNPEKCRKLSITGGAIYTVIKCVPPPLKYNNCLQVKIAGEEEAPVRWKYRWKCPVRRAKRVPRGSDARLKTGRISGDAGRRAYRETGGQMVADRLRNFEVVIGGDAHTLKLRRKGHHSGHEARGIPAFCELQNKRMFNKKIGLGLCVEGTFC